MNCGLSHHQLDDYLDNRLSWSERKRLEAHFASCSRCRGEVQDRSELDRDLWRALGSSAQQRSLPPQVSVQIVRGAKGALRRGLVVRKAAVWVQRLATGAGVVVVLAGLLAWLAFTTLPTSAQPPALAALRQWLGEASSTSPERPLLSTDLAGVQPAAVTTSRQPGITLSRGESLIVPSTLSPGEKFTITVFVQSNLPRPLKRCRVDIGIHGPSGDYRFTMSVAGPLPAEGVSVLQVTSDDLAAPSLAKYNMPATDIFSLPGDYLLSLVVYSPPPTSRD